MSVEFNEELFLSPAATKVGNEAFGLWVQMVLWAAKFDTTWAPEQLVRMAGGDADLAERLLSAGLLRRFRDGYAIGCPVVAANGRRAWAVKRNRPAIPELIRAAVFDRDGRKCVECGSSADLTLDHIHPWSLGGPDTEDNLRVLCRPCNSAKGARVK